MNRIEYYRNLINKTSFLKSNMSEEAIKTPRKRKIKEVFDLDKDYLSKLPVEKKDFSKNIIMYIKSVAQDLGLAIDNKLIVKLFSKDNLLIEEKKEINKILFSLKTNFSETIKNILSSQDQEEFVEKTSVKKKKSKVDVETIVPLSTNEYVLPESIKNEIQEFITKDLEHQKQIKANQIARLKQDLDYQYKNVYIPMVEQYNQLQIDITRIQPSRFYLSLEEDLTRIANHPNLENLIVENYDNKLLIWATTKTNIILQNCEIGKYSFCFDVKNKRFIILPQENNKSGNYYPYYHPHVTVTGDVCWGNAADLAQEHINNHRVYDLFNLAYRLLNSYNATSAYIRIEELSNSPSLIYTKAKGFNRLSFIHPSFRRKSSKKTIDNIVSAAPVPPTSDPVDYPEEEDEE